MAPATRIGDFGDPLPVEGFELDFGNGADQLESFTIGPQEARRAQRAPAGHHDEGVPVLRNMLLAIDGLEYGGRTVNTARGAARRRRQGGARARGRATLLQARRWPPGSCTRWPARRCLPAVHDRPVAADLRVLHRRRRRGRGGRRRRAWSSACYGLGALPINGWALAAMLVAFFGLAVDVQTGVPRTWTGIGLTLYAVGSLFLFREGLRPSWITLLAGIGGVALAFIVGMPSMVRARFATPTIGREWMIGELGEAAVAIDPARRGRGARAQWRARTNRATPLKRGDRLRVVAIDGYTLEVEPEVGGRRTTGSGAPPQG